MAQDARPKVNEEASDKVLEVEHKYTEIRRPVYGKQNDVIKTRHFWLTTSVSRALLNDLLSEEDQKNFSENPHIGNNTLTKTLSLTDEGATTVKAIPFKWKEVVEVDEELEGEEGEEGSEGEAGDGEEKKKRKNNFVYIF